MGVPKRLTEMQKRFAEYLVFNEGRTTGSDAAIAAGYSEKRARVEASELQNPRLSPLVVQYIGALREEKLKKYEWNTAEENLYKKKTVSQHSKNCRKLWDSPKGKEFRKHFERTKGKIPIFYKGQLNKIFDL